MAQEGIPLDELSDSKTTKESEKTIKSENKKKFIFDILMLVVAVIALIISIKSCENSKEAIEISKKSNEIASDTADFAKESFLYDQRPYLSVEVTKGNIINATTGEVSRKYLGIKQEGTEVTIKFQLRINNRGKTLAKNITLSPMYLKLEQGESAEEPITITNRSAIMTYDKGEELAFSLLPGQFINHTVTMRVVSAEIINKKKSDIGYEGTISYKHGHDDSVKYSSRFNFLISEDNVIYLK